MTARNDTKPNVEEILRADYASDERLARIRHRVFETSAISHRPPRRRPWIPALVAAALVVIATVSLYPPARTISAQVARSVGSFIAETLFPRTSDERVTIDERAEPSDSTVTLDSASELEQIAPFDVALLEGDLPGLVSSAWAYNPERNVSIQHYVTRTRSIRISQQPVEDAAGSGLLMFGFDLEIPESAVVREVDLGPAQAEIIRGMWVEADDAEGATMYRWSPDFYFTTLRWAHAGSIFEIQLSPAGGSPRPEWLEEEIVQLGRAIARDW